MIDSLTKHISSKHDSYKMTVLIPSWNNLSILQLCIRSILKNSHFDLQIIVIINEGVDGTLNWIKEQEGIDYVYSEKNIGICYALNSCRSLLKSDYIIYLNDDMYVLPDWDLELYNEIKKQTGNEFMLSATMIEHTKTLNPCVVVKDYGKDIEDFKEELLLKEYKELAIPNWTGSTWPPNVVHVDMWDLVGGMSIEFSPGMYSDPDLARKLLMAGVRNFKGIGSSLVYHFGSKSTKRVRKNRGRNMFLLKWGLTANAFTTAYLNIGSKYKGYVAEPVVKPELKWVNRIKRILSC